MVIKLPKAILELEMPESCKKCMYCGSTHDVWNYKGILPLCKKHREQMYKHGRIIKRTRNDPNEIITYYDHAEICLYDKNNKEIARAKISLEDVEKVKMYKWHIDGIGYVSCTKLSKRLHNFIMNPPEGFDVDHINHDTLDNRRENLRVCTRSQNCMNRLVKGVCYRKEQKKWRAYIKVNGKTIDLGGFPTEKEAIKARRKAEIKYYGEYAHFKTLELLKLVEGKEVE